MAIKFEIHYLIFLLVEFELSTFLESCPRPTGFLYFLGENHIITRACWIFLLIAAWHLEQIVHSNLNCHILFFGILDSFFAAWTDVNHTCYTMTTAGAVGFLALLPIYVDHMILNISLALPTMGSLRK
jgi:hypothetical protein